MEAEKMAYLPGFIGLHGSQCEDSVKLRTDGLRSRSMDKGVELTMRSADGNSTVSANIYCVFRHSSGIFFNQPY